MGSLSTSFKAKSSKKSVQRTRYKTVNLITIKSTDKCNAQQKRAIYTTTHTNTDCYYHS